MTLAVQLLLGVKAVNIKSAYSGQYHLENGPDYWNDHRFSGEYGWEQTDNGLTIVAETKANMDQQATIFKTIMRKCKCKKTLCKDGRCACIKDKQHCSSFCECLNCCNTNAKDLRKESDDATDSESESEIDEDDDEDEEITKDQTADQHDMDDSLDED